LHVDATLKLRHPSVWPSAVSVALHFILHVPLILYLVVKLNITDDPMFIVD
jgi:hypothetical protein